MYTILFYYKLYYTFYCILIRHFQKMIRNAKFKHQNESTTNFYFIGRNINDQAPKVAQKWFPSCNRTEVKSRSKIFFDRYSAWYSGVQNYICKASGPSIDPNLEQVYLFYNVSDWWELDFSGQIPMMLTKISLWYYRKRFSIKI